MHILYERGYGLLKSSVGPDAFKCRTGGSVPVMPAALSPGLRFAGFEPTLSDEVNQLFFVRQPTVVTNFR